MRHGQTSLKDATDKALAGAEENKKGNGEKRREQLKSFVDRLESNKEKLAQFNADQKGIYDEAEKCGFDRKALKEIVKLKTRSASDEHKANVNQYCLDLGMPQVYRQPTTH